MPVQSAPRNAAIVPFWNRLRAVMLYPAHGAAMATIVVLGLARLILFVPIIGPFLLLLPIAAMYRFAFSCLQSTADGFLVPPEVSVSGDRSLGRKYIYLVVILFVVVVFGMALLGPFLGTILMLFIGISVPGATMTLAMEESLSEALNPLKWVAIFTAIGWPYLAVLGLCLAIFGSEGYARAFVVKLLPLPAALVAIGIISNYALVMTFHLMGYLLYQYHEELGLTPTAPQTAQKIANADPDQETLDQAAECVRDGKPEGAVEILRTTVRRGASPAVHAQYRKLLRLTDNKKELLEHDREYINTLMGEQKDRLAIEFLCECQAIDPMFAPDTAFQITQLAIIAAKMGQPRAALQLVTVSSERFPKSQYSVDNSLLAATLMHEHLNQDEQALALLQELKATVPASDPRLAEIDMKIVAIERIMSATKKPVGAKPLGAV